MSEESDAALVESLTEQCVKELNDERRAPLSDDYLPWGGQCEIRKPRVFPTAKGEA